MTEWRYSVERRRYLYPSGRAVPAPRVVTLRQRFIAGQEPGADELARQLAAGAITVAQWERQARDLVKRAYIAEYALGAGGRQMMGPRDYGRIGGLLPAQYRYLRGFAEEIAAGALSQAQIADRTTLYLASATQVFERARAAGYEGLRLPCYPADGATACRSRCRCSWRIEELTAEWRAYYTVNSGESCGDCQSRSARYSPFIQAKDAA